MRRLGLSSGGRVTRSLGEVEAAARKAARGAGYPWGLAEDAGAAVRWLEARGVEGCAALVTVLRTVDGRLEDFAPGVNWRSPTGRLCPIMVGAALSDRLDKDASLERIFAPVLMLPVLAFMSKTHGRPVTLEVASGRAVLGCDKVFIDTALNDAPSAVRIQTGPTDTTHLDEVTLRTRSDVSDKTWKQMDRFAAKTYAPATEASRLKGAGAGLTDND